MSSLICTLSAIDPSIEFTRAKSALYSLKQHKQAALSSHFSFSPATVFHDFHKAPTSPAARNNNEHRHNNVVHRHSHRHHSDNQHSSIVSQHQHALVDPEYSIYSNAIVPAARTETHLFIESPQSFSTPNYYYHGPYNKPTWSSNSGSSFPVQVISSSNEREQESQLETPLSRGRPGSSNQPPPFIPGHSGGLHPRPGDEDDDYDDEDYDDAGHRIQHGGGSSSNSQKPNSNHRNSPHNSKKPPKSHRGSIATISSVRTYGNSLFRFGCVMAKCGLYRACGILGR